MLIQTAGGDGNMLLNVGPRPDGTIDAEQVKVIRGMGGWLAKHGESIYGTRGGPFQPGPWGVSTRKDNRIYLHVFRFEGNTLKLPAIPAKVTAARVLTGGSVEFKQSDQNITLTIPTAYRDPLDTLIALELDQPAMALLPLPAEKPVAGSHVGTSAAPAGPEKK